VTDSPAASDGRDPSVVRSPDHDREPALSVIVCTLAPRDTLESLAVLEAQPFDDYEVIVRNDGELAAARNAGAEVAASDRLIYLDDDAVPQADYLPAMLDALEANPLVAGRVHHPGTGAISALVGGYDKGDTRHYVDCEPGSFRRATTGVTGCNMAFHREVFEAVGGFDERFPWGHEETDFARRATEAGYRVLYDPDAAVTHWYADSVRGYWRKMAHFGPADLVYDRKWNTPLSERLAATLQPIRLGPTPAAAVVATIGNVVRSVSYARALLAD